MRKVFSIRINNSIAELVLSNVDVCLLGKCVNRFRMGRSLLWISSSVIDLFKLRINVRALSSFFLFARLFRLMQLNCCVLRAMIFLCFKIRFPFVCYCDSIEYFFSVLAYHNINEFNQLKSSRLSTPIRYILINNILWMQDGLVHSHCCVV